jgi:outer membrane protein OmpA-like peptidoglycan-associated protein
MKSSLVRVCLLIAALGLPVGAPPAFAQEKPGSVHELTSTEVTEDQLIEILAPKSDESPEPLRARGLGVATHPTCETQRREMTRGIAPNPVTEAVAIKIQFAFNSAALLPEAEQQLEVLGKALTSPRLAGSCIRIEGHADSIGSSAYNDQLSQARAEAVVHYLVEALKVDLQRLLPVGYGESQPLADNGTEEGRARNRRVQIANLGAG